MKKDEYYITRPRSTLIRKDRDAMERMAYIMQNEVPPDIIVFAFLKALVKYQAKRISRVDKQYVLISEDITRVPFSYFAKGLLVSYTAALLRYEIEPAAYIDKAVSYVEEYISPQFDTSIPMNLCEMARANMMDKPTLFTNLKRNPEFLTKLNKIGYLDYKPESTNLELTSQPSKTNEHLGRIYGK